MARYAQKLLKLGLIREVAAPEWVSAPRVKPERPQVMYYLTVDYRLVNAITRPKFWPILHIDAELADTRGFKAFAGIDFYSGYRQESLHPGANQYLHSLLQKAL